VSQKERVLRKLEAAGPKGVRSDEFYREFNGRGVARIYDLRKEGHEISDEREGKYKRYRLQNFDQAKASQCEPESTSGTTELEGGQAQRLDSAPEFVAREHSVPSMFDADIDWAS
jgi:hypothetical protein